MHLPFDGLEKQTDVSQVFSQTGLHQEHYDFHLIFRELVVYTAGKVRCMLVSYRFFLLRENLYFSYENVSCELS